MPKEIQGTLNGEGYKIAIVVGRFNQFICRSLLDGALDCLTRHGVAEGDITVYWVPGAFELPLAAGKAAGSGRFDAVLCLGAVIRGSTPHFDFVASVAANGAAGVAMQHQLPVLFGVITTDTIEQAIERAGTKAGNKGWDAAQSAIEMIGLLRQM